MQMPAHRLREVIELLRPVVSRKLSYTPLAGMLVKDGKATATNLEMTVTVELPEVEGQYLLPYHPVANLLKYIPSQDIVTVEQEGYILSLTWPEGKAILKTPRPDDYPPVPEMENVMEHVVDGNSLISALVSVADYCAVDESRPVLTGVLLKFGETTTVVGMNGFRMAWKTLPPVIPSRADGVIIPNRAVRLLGHLLAGAPKATPSARREMGLRLNKNMLQARFGPMLLTTNLIGEEYPNYEKLIPKGTTSRVEMMASKLERALRQVSSVVTKDTVGIIKLAWSGSIMTVSARSESMGEIKATTPVYLEGQQGRVTIYLHYLLSYLKGKSGPVIMELSSELSPVLLRHEGSPKVLIMPMAVQ